MAQVNVQHVQGGHELEKATMEGKNKIFGFWAYMAAESVLFASLFATFVALRNQTNGGPTGEELFQLPMVFVATVLLLSSSLTSVFAIQAMHRNNLKKMMSWFGVTMVLGLAFLGLEIYEFVEYVHEGHTITSSAFGSAFYLLVGTHGSHVVFGLLWFLSLMIQAPKKGITAVTAPKYFLASLYWHFVDLVWIFIFTVVYLMGKVG